MSIGMNLANLAFRFRYPLHCFIYVLGFLSPWDRWLHLDTGKSSWLILAGIVSRETVISFNDATIALLLLAMVLAVLAAAIRTWASAYMGANVVQDAKRHGNRLVTAGPFRYIRNPLYLGVFLHTLATALLMPPSGAVLSIILVGLLDSVLIVGEQAHLEAALGEIYTQYRRRVPSLLPSLKSTLRPTALKPSWGQGFAGEIYMWGAAVSFAVLGWHYNAQLIVQGLLVSFGLSLIVRATARPEASTRPAS